MKRAGVGGEGAASRRKTSWSDKKKGGVEEEKEERERKRRRRGDRSQEHSRTEGFYGQRPAVSILHSLTHLSSEQLRDARIVIIPTI